MNCKASPLSVTSYPDIYSHFQMNLDKAQQQTQPFEETLAPFPRLMSYELMDSCSLYTPGYTQLTTFCGGAASGSSPASGSQILDLILRTITLVFEMPEQGRGLLLHNSGGMRYSAEQFVPRSHLSMAPWLCLHSTDVLGVEISKACMWHWVHPFHGMRYLGLTPRHDTQSTCEFL